MAYQKQGAPLAVSGSAIWDDRADKFCEGTGIPAKKCNLGYILENCEYLKFITKELTV